MQSRRLVYSRRRFGRVVCLDLQVPKAQVIIDKRLQSDTTAYHEF